LEDIVHKISTVGTHFRETLSFLVPVKLKCPARRLQMKKYFKAGGDGGNRGDKIHGLIEKLN
jgi:large subunit ribosomal protein L7e